MRAMAQRKKHTSFYPWIDPKDHDKGFKLNFSMVTYIEVGRTPEGYKQAEFVALKSPELAHGFFWQSFYLVCYRHGSSAFTVGSTPSATIWHWSIRWYMPCCYTGYGIRGQKPFGSCTD
jgi:hypothetical protein